MPRSEVIHAVQGITEFSDAFIDDNYKISDDKYYGNGGKRKRKTSAPQKREVSEDESAESDKGGESSSTGEPINLMKKDPKILRSPESRSEHREDSEQKFWTSSVEQSRMYTTLLNYLLLKYQATSSFKGDSYGATGEHFSPSERPHHPIAFPSSSPGNASTHQFPSTSSSLGHSTLPETNMAQNNCTHPPIKGDQPPRNLFYRCPPSNELSWKQSIVHAISTCIHNIPIPKTGYVNYEAMLLCYKNLIEKAYALQQSIDLYLNLLQASPITDKSSPVNGVSAPINGISMHGKIYHTPFSNPQPPLLNYYHNASSNLAAALCDAQKILTAQASMYPTTGQWYNNEDLLKHRNGGSAHSGSDEEHSCTNDSTDQYPVDLTNSSSRFALHSPQTKDLPACPELPHKSGGSSKNEVSNVFSQFASSQSSDQQSRLPSNGSNSEYEPLHSSNDKFEFAFTSVTDTSCINSFRRAVSSEMPGNNILSGPLRMSFNQRKKAYFKTKRLRKSLSSSSSVNEKSFSEEGGSPVKKSNFRGTSEEENKVSPDFKPIEINGQVVLSEAHPNVKLSKDIFYSLIVKSSGSATRLIRLLMKSFFTQDELAASSLSGEGIYKQRLEPSVTEAIKIFIRRRHPQLKTGSINLCMTDVCVQARRVANNQRSRQHPLKIGSFSSETQPLHSPDGNGTDLSMSHHPNSPSLLGLKSRPITNKTIQPEKLSKTECAGQIFIGPTANIGMSVMETGQNESRNRGMNQPQGSVNIAGEFEVNGRETTSTADSMIKRSDGEVEKENRVGNERLLSSVSLHYSTMSSQGESFLCEGKPEL